MMNMITQDMIERMHESVAADRMVKTLQAAAAKTDLAELAYIPASGAKLNGAFSLELKTMPVTAQQKSGRCWAFAGMNILRETAAEKMGLEELELSGNYVAFWDKLEKCNDVLEMVIENAHLPFGHRMQDYIAYGIWDGGYWDMFVDIVNKYGIVPKDVMPETYTSAHTASLMTQLNRILRKDGAELKRMVQRGEDPTSRKEEMMTEIYKALVIVFGEPPRTFEYSWRDKDKEYHVERNMTPMSFYDKYIGEVLDDYVTVTSEPTSLKELNKNYCFHYIGCMAEGNIRFINLPLEELKELCLKQLRAEEPVWFACDVGHMSDRKMGILDPDSFDFGAILGGIDLSMSRTDGLEWHESGSTHAMLFTGVNINEEGKPDRWKIQNSWGSDVGNKGYFVCSDRYFDEYVYEAIINKKHLNDKQMEIVNSEATEIMPWEA